MWPHGREDEREFSPVPMPSLSSQQHSWWHEDLLQWGNHSWPFGSQLFNGVLIHPKCPLPCINCTGAAMVHIPEHSLGINKAEGICLTLAKMVWQYGSLNRQTSLAKILHRPISCLHRKQVKSRLHHMKHRLVEVRFLFCIFLQTCIPDQEMIYKQPEVMRCSKYKSPRCLRACMAFGWRYRQWLGTILAVTSLLCQGTFLQGWRILNTWQKGSAWSREPAELPRLLLLDCWEGKSCVFSKNGRKHQFQACGSTYSLLLAVCFSPQSQSSSVWSCQRLWPLWRLVCHSCLLTV